MEESCGKIKVKSLSDFHKGYVPCKHELYKTEIISRCDLTKKQYLKMLSTPKGQRFQLKVRDDSSEDSCMNIIKEESECNMGDCHCKAHSIKKRRSCQVQKIKKNRHSLKPCNKKRPYLYNFLGDMYSYLTPDIIDNLKELLMKEFGLKPREAEEFLMNQGLSCMLKTSNENKKENCLPCFPFDLSQSAPADTTDSLADLFKRLLNCPPPPPNFQDILCGSNGVDKKMKTKKSTYLRKSSKTLCISPSWIKDMSHTLASKLSDYIEMMLTTKRTKRVKCLSEDIFKSLCQLTGEVCTMSSAETTTQKIMVFLADRLAIWLVNIPCACDRDLAKICRVKKEHEEVGVEEEEEEEKEEEKKKKPPPVISKSVPPKPKKKKKKSLTEPKEKKDEPPPKPPASSVAKEVKPSKPPMREPKPVKPSGPVTKPKKAEKEPPPKKSEPYKEKIVSKSDKKDADRGSTKEKRVSKLDEAPEEKKVTQEGKKEEEKKKEVEKIPVKGEDEKVEEKADEKKVEEKADGKKDEEKSDEKKVEEKADEKKVEEQADEKKVEEKEEEERVPDEVEEGEKVPEEIKEEEKVPDEVKEGEKVPEEVKEEEKVPEIVEEEKVVDELKEEKVVDELKEEKVVDELKEEKEVKVPEKVLPVEEEKPKEKVEKKEPKEKELKKIVEERIKSPPVVELREKGKQAFHVSKTYDECGYMVTQVPSEEVCKKVLEVKQKDKTPKDDEDDLKKILNIKPTKADSGTADQLKEWTEFASNVIEGAENWRTWIDKVCSEAVGKVDAKTESDAVFKWRAEKQRQALRWKLFKNSINEAAEIWNRKFTQSKKPEVVRKNNKSGHAIHHKKK